MTARQASAAIVTTGAVGDGGSKEWLVLDTMDAMAGLERAFSHFTQTATILARQDWDKTFGNVETKAVVFP